MAKKENETEKKQDFKLLKGIPEGTYNGLLEYLSHQPYREVAGMINGMGRAIDVKVTPEDK